MLLVISYQIIISGQPKPRGKTLPILTLPFAVILMYVCICVYHVYMCVYIYIYIYS